MKKRLLFLLNLAYRLPEWAVVGSFFAGLLLLGVAVVRDYGISFDEAQSHLNGLVSLKYVAGLLHPTYLSKHTAELAAVQNINFQDYYDRDYGVAFELPVAWLAQALGLTDWRSIFFLRHFCTFLVCLGGVGAVYALARRRFADWRLALLGALLLVLSPRLFAEFFYNDKDAVFMALFAIATNSAVALVARPSWGRAGWHALACALTIDVRIMGVLLPLATLALLALQAGRGAYAGQRVAAQTAAYLALLAALTVALWPFLWADPLGHFAEAFANMAKFRWDGTLLYRNSFVKATELPWHYAPVWIAITTPLLHLAGFGVGTALILRRLGRRRWRLYATAAEWQDLLFLGLTLAPLLAVVALHSVLYDGWRQLYFVYPSLLLVALRGLAALGRWRPAAPGRARAWAWASRAGLAAALLAVAGQMAALHPLQNVYFNALAGRHPEERYEMDHWALSYRTGLEWLARHDNGLRITVCSESYNLLVSSQKMLPEFDQSRIQVVEDWNQADYFLTTYRWHPWPYTGFAYEATTVRRADNRVLSVFRRRW